jgi:hypothetical protein
LCTTYFAGCFNIFAQINARGLTEKDVALEGIVGTMNDDTAVAKHVTHRRIQQINTFPCLLTHLVFSPTPRNDR